MSHGDGLVYFVLDATNREQRVKIGYSSGLKVRIDALAQQTVTGARPILLALEKGGLEREKKLHARFCDLRVFGEWFRYEGELRDYVAELPTPGAWILDEPELWPYAQGMTWRVPQANPYRPCNEDDEVWPEEEPDSDVEFVQF